MPNYYAKDSGNLQRPYLINIGTEDCWGTKQQKPIKFSSAEAAIEAGRAEMGTSGLKERIVAEPV